MFNIKTTEEVNNEVMEEIFDGSEGLIYIPDDFFLPIDREGYTPVHIPATPARHETEKGIAA